MKATEIAWAAGLFEGEGCITIFEQKQNVLPLIRLSVQMTDRDVLERFCRIVECGRVQVAHRAPRGNRKPTFGWSIGNRPDVERILLEFLPWLCERRAAKARLTLAEIAKLDRRCRSCNKPFRARRHDTHFCGITCRNRWNYLNRRPAERPSPVGRPRVL
ncbi:MAG TPA: LAGLIDADG family homing endonuclease [Kribbellaceae bacterium]|nr:LAGLIDADG family homing endonuclease [Kribbellaceae bacterium]